MTAVRGRRATQKKFLAGQRQSTATKSTGRRAPGFYQRPNCRGNFWQTKTTERYLQRRNWSVGRCPLDKMMVNRSPGGEAIRKTSPWCFIAHNEKDSTQHIVRIMYFRSRRLTGAVKKIANSLEIRTKNVSWKTSTRHCGLSTRGTIVYRYHSCFAESSDGYFRRIIF